MVMIVVSPSIQYFTLISLAAKHHTPFSKEGVCEECHEAAIRSVVAHFE
jgi:hypothetical protein